MKVTATINGANVTVVSIVPNGHQIAVAYIDASQNLKVNTYFLSGNNTLLGTGAVSVS